MAKTKQEIDKAVSQPWTVYQTPEAVLADKTLDDSQKRRILESWEHDARELAVAEEENMGGGEPNVLDRVLQALATLPAEEEQPRGPATMHGTQSSPSSTVKREAAELSEEEARQGEIILYNPLRRGIFISAIIICAAAVLLWTFWAA